MGKIVGTEANIEAKFKEMINDLGGLAYKFVSPGRRGMPDQIWVLNREFWGMVELKAPDGRLESWQEREHMRLLKKGVRVNVIWSEEQVKEFGHYLVEELNRVKEKRS